MQKNKPVAFVAKVNKVWVDGICLIEHISFDFLIEGTRMKSSRKLLRRYTRKCSQMGADGIHATNEHRKCFTAQGIATRFGLRASKAVRRTGKQPCVEQAAGRVGRQRRFVDIEIENKR